MEIKLKKLSLRDFQGGTIILNADGKDVFIFGENATGKTRLVSAFNWLLFNKDALGRSDFEIKNLDETGTPAHGLEHTVGAELDVDGQTVNLKKVLKEKWPKKRGSLEREFSGHITEYYVDGIPLQERLYNQHIIDLAGDESRFRLLTSPTTFPSLHWQKQRQLLLEICGDLSDTDVIASDAKLTPLTGILGKRSLDDHRKVVIARRSEINKEMEKIPVRIDEVRRGIPDITGLDRMACEVIVQDLETALNSAKLRLQGVDTGGRIADFTKKLAGLNADLRKMENVHRSESLENLNRLNQQVSEVGAKLNAGRRRFGLIEGDLKSKSQSLELSKSTLARLREKWTLIDSEIFKDITVDTCPACGRALPSDRVLEAKEKTIAIFNENKAERLGEIDLKGKNLREQRNRLNQEIEGMKQEKDSLALEIPSTEHDLQALTEERDALKQYSEDFSSLPHWSETFGEIEAYEQEIKAEREGKIQDIEEIKTEIATLNLKLLGAKEQVDKFVRREQGEKRIQELKIQEKELSKEFERLEGELYLIEQFIKTKVSLLTDRINAKFETVRFKLFNQLINGGIEDVCEITVNGVGFNSGLNNAARIQAGCDIIRTLQQHFGMKAPIFVDNREAVTDLPRLSCQMISLVVSPKDKILRVEVP